MARRDEAETESTPGCGLAVYALLLLSLGAVGVAGLMLSSLALLRGDGTSPTALTSGSDVETWRLAPLVKAGVLRPDEVPAAWHDESVAGDGSRACALCADAVLRIEDGKGTRLPFAALALAESAVTPDGATVVRVATKDSGFSCLFGADDGGQRFLRQIQTEMARAAPKDGPR